jgi:hypothetical protein
VNHFIQQNQGTLAILGLWIAAAALLTLNHYINRWKENRKP